MQYAEHVIVYNMEDNIGRNNEVIRIQHKGTEADARGLMWIKLKKRGLI